MSKLLLCFIISFAFSSMGNELNERRLNVVFTGNDWSDQAFLIRCLAGSLQWTATTPRLLKDGTSWSKLEAPGDGSCFSNPVTTKTADNTTYLFVQDTSGEVYITEATITRNSLSIGKWLQVGGNLPFEEDAHMNGFDSVVVKAFENKIYTFSRSHTKASYLYWSAVNNNSTSTKWAMVGGSSAKLMTDVAIAYNSFTKLMEAFMVATDGYMYRSWQLSFDKWSTWDKTGYSAPKTTHVPVAHAMDANVFNGRLNVFVHGNDGKLHHIWQTTCDKVPNPWGWCTWSTWNEVSGDVPLNPNYPTNSLSIGNNLHLGIEVFVVDAKGQLYKTWQLQRHTEYSEWELVKSMGGYAVASLPAITNDRSGWWTAYAMDSNSDLIIVQQDRNFSISPTSVKSGGFLAVSWNMPVDEASSKDWIGVFPSGASNKDYVDYVYVDGTQNPMSEAVASGNVTFFTYLPRGLYDVRYLVDRQFVAATGTSLTISKSTEDSEWVQIFKGIFTGLNITAVDVESCVKDAEDIPVKFHDSFQAFKDRSVFKGLSLFGLAIGDVVKGMVDCGVKDAITGRIEVFVKDLVSCVSTENCAHFFIDVAKELLVLYENVYEIYGDIRGASNCFDIEAYAQGGVNVGRVIGACIDLPR